ncbi:MAG: lytic transglycosylase domain-containing protein [Pseudorhodoplanes sp.]
MAVDATLSAGAVQNGSVTAAIRKASQVTGAKFSYLIATAKVESNLNPNAAAPTSSAGGLFQFIDRTWLGTLKEAGSLVGYSRYADAITKTDDGRYVVNDPAMRREIMALRQDPTANSMMAGIFTNSNAKHLSNKLGRAPSDSELYIAHFMGASGAARLISASEANPGAIAAQSFPTAARANRSIFFDRSGRARNFAEVSQNLSSRYNSASAKVPSFDQTGSIDAAKIDPAKAAAPVAEIARVNRAYQVADNASRVTFNPVPEPNAVTNRAIANQVVQGERVFSNPYRAGERVQPVSSAVADLWTGKVRTSQQESVRNIARELESRARPQVAQIEPPAQVQPAAAQDISDGTLGLFQDSKPDVRSLFTRGVRG